MIQLIPWVAAALLSALAVAPSLSFLRWGWEARRREILDGLNESAAKLYFTQFHRKIIAEGVAREQLAKYYVSQFGRTHFVLPVILFSLTVGCALLWTVVTAFQFPGLDPTSTLFGLATAALMGGYAWVVYDQISHWYDNELSPADLYWATFRLAISVPIGVALAAALKPEAGAALAFLVGAFPTNTLMTLARRAATKQAGLSDVDSGQESQLQLLQGIDRRTAERFSAEGITTILQLAYCDPIKLTIRTNLGFSYVVDCASQALLWTYMEQALVTMRKYGLRGAYECVSLLQGAGRKPKDAASAICEQLAQELHVSKEALGNILDEVVNDPYSQFLYHSWAPASSARQVSSVT